MAGLGLQAWSRTKAPPSGTPGPGCGRLAGRSCQAPRWRPNDTSGCGPIAPPDAEGVGHWTPSRLPMGRGRLALINGREGPCERPLAWSKMLEGLRSHGMSWQDLPSRPQVVADDGGERDGCICRATFWASCRLVSIGARPQCPPQGHVGMQKHEVTHGSASEHRLGDSLRKAGWGTRERIAGPGREASCQRVGCYRSCS